MEKWKTKSRFSTFPPPRFPLFPTKKYNGAPRRLTRDIYVPARDVGFWQGAFRDPSAPGFAEAKAAIEAEDPLTVDILYGDHEGGQRTVTRFALLPHSDGVWLASAGRYWNVDRDDPRPTP